MGDFRRHDSYKKNSCKKETVYLKLGNGNLHVMVLKALTKFWRMALIIFCLDTCQHRFMTSFSIDSSGQLFMTFDCYSYFWEKSMCALMTLTGKNCFIVQEWLLLIFLMCLHNELKVSLHTYNFCYNLNYRGIITNYRCDHQLIIPYYVL